MLKWLLICVFSLSAFALPASAFCGFYVAQADGDLFNTASKVAVARKGDRTVVTMANDYQGDPSEFAVVVPVPSVISREQVNISDPELLKTLDRFSAPRLAEYYDDDPCAPETGFATDEWAGTEVGQMESVTVTASTRRSLGVTIEDSYSAGEYDILILSAENSDGLLEWLNASGYKLPDGAERILDSYIKAEMKFFVAKVDLARKADSGTTFLRPISIAYEDEDFSLPIRLGTLNADGSQDLIAFMLTSRGRVETSNYKMRKIPTDKDIPLFLKEESGSFGEFYKAMFDRQVKRAGGAGVFLEYFWNVGSCDPCAGDPPSVGDLLQLGVFWMDEYGGIDKLPTFDMAWADSDADLEEVEYFASDLNDYPYWGGNLFLTRLHIRYDARRFPEDLKFIETGDDRFFQGRYVINVPWRGEATCGAAEDYITEVANRQNREFSNLASLTGWKKSRIRARAETNGDYPFSLTPKPERPVPEDRSDEIAAKSIYDRFFWWGEAFTDLVEPDTAPKPAAEPPNPDITPEDTAQDTDTRVNDENSTPGEEGDTQNET